jgi:hypothetical protein
MSKPKQRVTALERILTRSSKIVPQGTATDLPGDEAEDLREKGLVEFGDKNAKAVDEEAIAREEALRTKAEADKVGE